MRHLRFVRTVGSALTLWLALGTLTTEAATVQHEEIVSNAVKREYFLATPDDAPSTPMPLVLVLHGHAGTAANALGQNGQPSPLSAWLPIADREQVIVAALQGANGPDGNAGWNDCRADAHANPTTDDVRFARDVIAALQQRKLIDPARVYAMGMSNGAMMVQRLALELDPPLAAFAAVSGSLAANSQCKPATHPVSALLIQGTADPLVPFKGGQVHFFRNTRGAVVSAADNVQFWLKANHLADTPPAVTHPEHRNVIDNPSLATRELYGKTSAAPQVEMLTIAKGGHVEPSLAHHYGLLYESIVGKQNQDLESAEEAWQFFRDKRTP